MARFHRTEENEVIEWSDINSCTDHIDCYCNIGVSSFVGEVVESRFKMVTSPLVMVLTNSSGLLICSSSRKTCLEVLCNYPCMVNILCEDQRQFFIDIGNVNDFFSYLPMGVVYQNISTEVARSSLLHHT